MATDEALMEMVAAAQRAGRSAPGGAAGEPDQELGWTYAIVLTKADKRRGRGATDRVERQVHAALERAGCLAHSHVVRTSAKSRLGRDEMWRLHKLTLTLPLPLPLTLTL